MVVMVVIAGVSKVRISASNVREAFATGHTMPCHIVVQADGSTVALRHRGSIETLEAPALTHGVPHQRCDFGMGRATLVFKGPKAICWSIVLAKILKITEVSPWVEVFDSLTLFVTENSFTSAPADDLRGNP